MRIYTKAGDLAFKTFTFPDGQPHFKLETIDDSGFTDVTIETAIKSPSDLFLVGLAVDVLRNSGFSSINLDCRYLLSARMDRAISHSEPFSLSLVARFLNSLGFSKVRLLDVHSEVATKLIRNSVNVLPHRAVGQVLVSTAFPHIVCPDKGATERTRALANGSGIIQCSKKRDMATGALTGFQVHDAHWLKDHQFPHVLIIDDICDGGGTFVGLAKELRATGAKKVFLFCTHGIFSKGLPLEGIDHIYTTNSYTDSLRRVSDLSCEQWKWAGLTTPIKEHATVIPVSMKELP